MLCTWYYIVVSVSNVSGLLQHSTCMIGILVEPGMIFNLKRVKELRYNIQIRV